MCTGRVQGSAEVWWCPIGEWWLLVTCVQVVDSPREKLFCIFCNLAHPKSQCIFQSCVQWSSGTPGQFSHCRGCAPGEARLDVSVAYNVVAQEGNQDLLGTASPSSTCHTLSLVVPFSISRGLPLFRSSLVWPISGC